MVLTLKLFGAPALEAAGGPVAGRAGQGHRLALLAVLALARGRPVSRDRLTGLLWPESSTDRARHQLSDTLYILRSALGNDVVRSSGDELVLNPDAVASDVGAFERLLDDGQLESAVELAAGPLMDGFHLADGGELERWLDSERARLGHRQAAALETLAEAAAGRGDLAAAERWWRRLAAHDPLSARVALGLMRALVAAGDRAGALRHARIHAALLKAEFESGPDPDVAAFAERLRAECPARDAPRQSAAAPTAVPAVPAARASPPDATDLRSTRQVSASEQMALASPDLTAARDGWPPEPSPRGRSSAAEWRWPARGRAAVAVAAVMVVLAGAWSYGVARARATAPALARSLAVLPFVNMSPDPATGYFSDGLSEQIITALSRIPGLRVAARTSSFALRDSDLDVRVIGDTLGVEAVLEGSVRREGETLRVTAQLIDARTGYHLWSGEYDRALTDALVLQDEIAGAIAAALELRLPPRAAPSRSRGPPDPAAYDLYLRALYLRDDMSGDAMLAAIPLLDRAIELEPDFALAWAAKAHIMGPLITYGHVPRARGLPAMRGAVDRALELDPELGEAHVALGMVRLFFDWDWAGGERALRQAVALNPNDPHAWHHLGNQLGIAGRYDEAVDARRRGVALDPLNARLHGILAADLSTAGRHEEAAAEYERARQLDPMNPNVLGVGPGLPIGAAVHLGRGRPTDAVAELVRVAALRGAAPDELDALRSAFGTDGMPGVWRRWLAMDERLTGGAVDSFRRSLLHALAGDTARALDWLERAHAERNPGIVFVQGWGRLLPELRDHPRFRRVLEQMKLSTR